MKELLNQIEIDFLKSKSYEEINDMFNSLNRKLLEAQAEVKKMQQHNVMQAEVSGVSEGAAVASEGREKHVRGGCIDRTRKKDGPCCYDVGTCDDCQVP